MRIVPSFAELRTAIKPDTDSKSAVQPHSSTPSKCGVRCPLRFRHVRPCRQHQATNVFPKTTYIAVTAYQGTLDVALRQHVSTLLRHSSRSFTFLFINTTHLPQTPCDAACRPIGPLDKILAFSLLNSSCIANKRCINRQTLSHLIAEDCHDVSFHTAQAAAA